MNLTCFHIVFVGNCHRLIYFFFRLDAHQMWSSNKQKLIRKWNAPNCAPERWMTFRNCFSSISRSTWNSFARFITESNVIKCLLIKRRKHMVSPWVRCSVLLVPTEQQLHRIAQFQEMLWYFFLWNDILCDLGLFSPLSRMQSRILSFSTDEFLSTSLKTYWRLQTTNSNPNLTSQVEFHSKWQIPFKIAN